MYDLFSGAISSDFEFEELWTFALVVGPPSCLWYVGLRLNLGTSNLTYRVICIMKNSLYFANSNEKLPRYIYSQCIEKKIKWQHKKYTC